ncbi:hypothetical protein PG993_002404 [Apiospora rasikravindrae]|uniref:Uncharacterized protein n=1 Tax=Apiospora rasikravindrae TaxID=990691 RepID=A0ABR1TZA4_9PEZI
MGSSATTPGPQPAIIFPQTANTNTNIPQSQWPLVNYWADQWRSPNPDKSKECLALAVVASTLLAVDHHIAQRYFLLPGLTETVTDCFVLDVIYLVLPLKAVGLFAQGHLLMQHTELRSSAYSDQFKKHEPLYAGLIASCLVLATRALAPGCGLGLDLLLYSLESWFWVGYWFEWWTGFFSQSVLGGLGVV